MTTYQIDGRVSLNKIEDLTTPTSTAKYPLGVEVIIEDSAYKAVKRYKYVYAPTGGLTQYVPYNISNTQESGKEVVAIAPAATSGVVSLIGWPQVAITSGYYGFVQVEGNLTSVLTAASGVAGLTYKVLAGGTTLTRTAGTTQTPLICAYLVTTTSGTSGSMYAPGYRVQTS
jgi:hypothetical protein